jgi:methyl-accepting chemotaxis protein
MRLNKGLPSIEEGASSDFITDADIALKQAYETEVRLPVYHAFSNRIVGNTTKLALGESSIVRYIDYFPSAARPVTGLCLFWTENDLDKIFCLKAIKEVRKTNPGMGFNIYKSSGAGLTKIAQNLKNSDLKAEAQIAANRESQYFSRERNNLLKVAIPSKRRPNLILAGSMDINYIDKRINSLKKDYLLYAFLGIVALIFFLKLLHLRLIYPITHLIEYLENIKQDNFITAPISSRQDELKNIFEVYNQMVDGL